MGFLGADLVTGVAVADNSVGGLSLWWACPAFYSGVFAAIM